MSIDRLKKQAKNAQKLLEDFLAAHTPPFKLSDCQDLVARLNGYPDWFAAESNPRLKTSEQNAGATHSDNNGASRDAWMLEYQEYEAAADTLITSEIRLLDGPSDALAMFWHSFSGFEDRQPFPGMPEDFHLSLESCDRPSAVSATCLALHYKTVRRRLLMRLYPLDQAVALFDKKLVEATPEIATLLRKRQHRDDMQPVLDAANVLYNEFKQSLHRYHEEHPSKGLFISIEQQLHEHMEKLKKDQGPRDGIWTCNTWRLDNWRIQLLFLPATDTFHIDFFDEGRKQDSFTWPADDTVVRQTGPTGFTVSDTARTEKLRLKKVTNAMAIELRKVLVACGVAITTDDAGKINSNPEAPERIRFIEWARKEKPEILRRGQYEQGDMG